MHPKTNRRQTHTASAIQQGKEMDYARRHAEATVDQFGRTQREDWRSQGRKLRDQGYLSAVFCSRRRRPPWDKMASLDCRAVTNALISLGDTSPAVPRDSNEQQVIENAIE